MNAVIEEQPEQYVHHERERERAPSAALTRRLQRVDGLRTVHCGLTSRPTRLTPRAFKSDITFITVSYRTVLSAAITTG